MTYLSLDKDAPELPASVACGQRSLALPASTRYESVTFEHVHDWLLSALPDRPGIVLDVGAGTGRDAAWLAAHGHEVVALKP